MSWGEKAARLSSKRVIARKAGSAREGCAMEKEPFDIEAALQKVDALCQGQGERVERVEGKLERHDELLSSMVLLLTRLERTQEQHSKKFEQLDAKIDLRFEQLQSDFRAFKEVLTDHRQRIQACEQRAS